LLIAFCTSMRARALAGTNWDYHVWLLERVVESMLAQRDVEVAVVVACHDVPALPRMRDSRIHFLPVAVEVPERNFDDMVSDKVLKLSAGARWAQSRGADYAIFNDADDLVSNRLGSFVAARRGASGWYTGAQRFYTYGGTLMRLQRIGEPAAGPCVIVRSDLLAFDAPPFHGRWRDLVAEGGEARYLQLLSRHGVEVCTLAAAGIGHYRTLMASQGHPLDPLPFAGNIVINHKDSMSTTGGAHGYPLLSGLGSLRRSLRWLPTLRLATPSVRREFRIPPDREIPAPYRGGASVFWR
jgi:hypothetical protein